MHIPGDRADSLKVVKASRIVSCAILSILISAGPLAQDVHAYRLMYKEEFYRLYHQQLYMQNMDIAENIHWLEAAMKADFANPLNALAKIKDKRDWEKYRDLFNMHLNLKMVECYLQWASRYNKQEAYFYNAPWQQLNIESLDKAEALLRVALVYWADAVSWSQKAESFRWIYLKELQEWQDEQYRIQNDELDYQAIIERHLGKIAQVRQTFKNMDAGTY